MTLHRPAHAVALPDVFPLKTARRGCHSPVSIADKRALFEHAFWRRLTQTETARAAGVSPSTIAAWKKSILQDKARSANKMDQKALRLVISNDVTAQPERAANAANPAPEDAQKQDGIPGDPREAEIRKLLARMREEGLTNREAAAIAGTNANVVSSWRREFGYAARRRAPSPLTEGQRVALLTRQREEGLSNRDTAELAGVCEATITVWRKDLGFAGRRGRAPAMSDQDKQALFALKEEEGLTDRQLADLAGVTAGTISIWRSAMKRRTETPGPITGNALRRVVLTRPDGALVQLDATQDEVRGLLGLARDPS